MSIQTISFHSSRKVPKGWGYETQIANRAIAYRRNGESVEVEGHVPNIFGYSGKLLVYEKAGAISSMHFHTTKHETFYILSGEFLFYYYDPQTADKLHRHLCVGDIVAIPPCNPHQLRCVSAGVVLEFATLDFEWDNFRIAKGDSQYPHDATAERGPS